MAKYFLRKCAAALAAFSLTVAVAALPSLDRHDEHLNAKVKAKYQKQDKAAQEYADAAYEAMVRRNAAGDYGEVYEAP